MPTARSRLADIEGPGLGKPLSEDAIDFAVDRIRAELLIFLNYVQANQEQIRDAKAAFDDGIAVATARQLREIEEGEG